MSKPSTAKELLDRMRPDPAYHYDVAPTGRVQVDPETKKVLDDLFLRIKGACGAWKQSWPNDEIEGASKAEWTAEFIRSGIRKMEQIQHGMRVLSASRSPFVPAPGVFVSWCFAPEGLGLPSLEVAYKQALKNSYPCVTGPLKWFHPAVYHATAAAGFMSLQSLNREQGMARFERKYLEQCKLLWSGVELNPIPAAELAAPGRMITPEIGNTALAELRNQRNAGL